MKYLLYRLVFHVQRSYNYKQRRTWGPPSVRKRTSKGWPAYLFPDPPAPVPPIHLGQETALDTLELGDVLALSLVLHAEVAGGVQDPPRGSPSSLHNSLSSILPKKNKTSSPKKKTCLKIQKTNRDFGANIQTM